MEGVLLGVAGGDEGDAIIARNRSGSIARSRVDQVGCKPTARLEHRHIREPVFLDAGDQRIDHAFEQLAIDGERAALKAERHTGEHADLIGLRG